MLKVTRTVRGRLGLEAGCLRSADERAGGPGAPGGSRHSLESLESGSVSPFSICWLQQLWPYGDVNSRAGSFSSQEGALRCRVLQTAEAKGRETPGAMLHRHRSSEEEHAGHLGGHVVCHKEATSKHFPHGPVVKTPRVHCRGKRSILHATVWHDRKKRTKPCQFRDI